MMLTQVMQADQYSPNIGVEPSEQSDRKTCRHAGGRETPVLPAYFNGRRGDC